jgi:hypothetical protein
MNAHRRGVYVADSLGPAIFLDSFAWDVEDNDLGLQNTARLNDVPGFVLFAGILLV